MGNSSRESAEIIQFPAGGRAGANRNRQAAKQAQEHAPAFAKVMSGGGWYHEEAIQDAGRDRSN